MVDPKVLVFFAVIGMGYYVYDEALKPAAVKVAHVAKATGKKVVHLLRKL